MFEPIYEGTRDAVIKVIGVGGGGGNALNHMVATKPENMGSVEFFSVNTDAQVLRSSIVPNTIQIGANITKGLGAGGDPNKAHQAAEEDREALVNMLAGADMVFIAAGMGGGTGTGAAPVIAQIAKEQGALTIAIVTKPFYFEQKKRSRYAEQGIEELSKHVDSLIIIHNDKLLKVLPKNVTYKDALAAADDVLRNSVLGISDMIISEGILNVDFNDVRQVMSEKGRAMIGTGLGEGEDRAEKAAKEAVASPLLEDVDLSGARGILVNIVSGEDIELNEVETIVSTVTSFADPDAAVIYGSAFDPSMEGKIRVTLVATGIGKPEETLQSKLPPKTGYDTNSNQVSGHPFPPMGTPFGGSGYPQNNFGHTMNSMSQQPVAKPQAVDNSQMFSPNSIPPFMRNSNQ